MARMTGEAADAGVRRLTLVPVDVALQVLVHGVLYPLPAHEKDGAFADIHAMVGDALEVVDYQGRPHAPLGGTGAPVRRVGYEVHGLGIEEVHLVVSRLEAASA